ncbi:unnamed protein product [Thlaspi arvense]|uniref:RING-type E3 ubiquitin transferase n=1 Tax=Thlaspi arvense TaxID=13288 RepID=A0AAU9TC56_THLAR|nr:unnamed protein product [Thlaspi arvense]
MESPPWHNMFSSFSRSIEKDRSWLPLLVWIVGLLIAFIIILICQKREQTPTESALETRENSRQPQDIETGHLTPPQLRSLPQQDTETGYMTWINQLSIETTILEFKDIKEEGFDEICCSICLEEFEDGHEIICIKKCRHVFHPLCIDSWLKQNRSCPNCRCSLNARKRKEIR